MLISGLPESTLRVLLAIGLFLKRLLEKGEGYEI